MAFTPLGGPTSAPSGLFVAEGSGGNDACDGHCILIVILGVLLVILLVAGSMCIHCYYSSPRRRQHSSSGVGLLGTPLLDEDEEKQYLADNEGKTPYADATTEAFFDSMNAESTPSKGDNIENADLVAPPFEDEDAKPAMPLLEEEL